MSDELHADVLRHTARVVSAHLGHNKIAADDLPELIRSVHRALAGLGVEPVVTDGTRTPAVPIRRSVFPDHIVCLEDGGKVKMLKRYLQTRFGLTPSAYRERWGLPPDYPMVAPGYAKTRSALAKQIGLGRKRTGATPDTSTVEATPEPEPQSGPEPEPQADGDVPVTKMSARRAKGSKG